MAVGVAAAAGAGGVVGGGAADACTIAHAGAGAVVVRAPGDIRGRSVRLADCTGATLALCDWSEGVQADRLVSCRVLIGASGGSVFLRGCVGCAFTVACRQLRLRDCADCSLSLACTSEPVIERSHGLRFAPWAAAFPRAKAAWAAAGLDARRAAVARVHDFSADDAALPRPHWTLLPAPPPPPWRLGDVPGCAGEPPVDPALD